MIPILLLLSLPIIRVVFYDGGIPREVVAKSMQETFTQYDPETLERDALAIDQRLPLFDEMNKVEE
jgi:hypothetical protein